MSAASPWRLAPQLDVWRATERLDSVEDFGVNPGKNIRTFSDANVPADRLPAPAPGESRPALAAAAARMKPRDRARFLRNLAIYLGRRGGLTYGELGEAFGISRERAFKVCSTMARQVEAVCGVPAAP